MLLCLTLVALRVRALQRPVHSFLSAVVIGRIPRPVIAGLLFVRRERRAADPVMSFPLLRSHPNGHLSATISQLVAGMAEMGLSVIFPLILVLNLKMTPRQGGAGADSDHDPDGDPRPDGGALV